MTESVLSTATQAKASRLDPPHNLLSSADDKSSPWMAFAGRDPNVSTQQVDRQASELLSYVQEQNKEIDVRQAELNAKLAQLDNQLRNARLHSNASAGTELSPEESAAKNEGMLDSGLDLESYANKPALDSELDELETMDVGIVPDESIEPYVAEINYVQQEVDVRVNHFHSAHTDQEFEEVERLVAQFSGSSADAEEAVEQIEESAAVEEETATIETSEPATCTHPRNRVDAFPKLLADSHLERVDTRLGGNTSATELESERRLLAEKKLELDRRKAVLGRMQEETQALHREALEMRLVTEQLWGQLSETTPPEQLSDLIASLRARLDSEYSNEKAVLEDRKHELISVQTLLEQKQVALREQSSKMQDWFAVRQDEIKTFATELDAREMLLDRREHRMADEFAKWEAERQDYERQLKGLVRKLNLNGLQ